MTNLRDSATNFDDLRPQTQHNQQQAEEIQRPYSAPAGWRKRGFDGHWHLCRDPLSPSEMEALGWEPVWTRRKPLSNDYAQALTKNFNGLALVRAVETAHGI